MCREDREKNAKLREGRPFGTEPELKMNRNNTVCPAKANQSTHSAGPFAGSRKCAAATGLRTQHCPTGQVKPDRLSRITFNKFLEKKFYWINLLMTKQLSHKKLHWLDFIQNPWKTSAHPMHAFAVSLRRIFSLQIEHLLIRLRVVARLLMVRRRYVTIRL